MKILSTIEKNLYDVARRTPTWVKGTGAAVALTAAFIYAGNQDYKTEKAEERMMDEFLERKMVEDVAKHPFGYEREERLQNWLEYLKEEREGAAATYDAALPEYHNRRNSETDESIKIEMGKYLNNLLSNVKSLDAQINATQRLLQNNYTKNADKVSDSLFVFDRLAKKEAEIADYRLQDIGVY